MGKGMRLLKNISALFSAVILLGSVMSMPVFASGSMCSGSTSTESVEVEYVSDKFEAEMEEFNMHMISGNDLKVGEERVLGVWNGEKFCVRVTDIKESPLETYSSTTTTSKEFIFYTKNILGIKKDVLKVLSECTWVKGSKISNLRSTYTTYVSDISCSWNDNYKKATDTNHTLGLDVIFEGKSGIIFFGARLSIDRQTLTLDCSEDYEL